MSKPSITSTSRVQTPQAALSRSRPRRAPCECRRSRRCWRPRARRWCLQSDDPGRSCACKRVSVRLVQVQASHSPATESESDVLRLDALQLPWGEVLEALGDEGLRVRVVFGIAQHEPGRRGGQYSSSAGRGGGWNPPDVWQDASPLRNVIAIVHVILARGMRQACRRAVDLVVVCALSNELTYPKVRGRPSYTMRLASKYTGIPGVREGTTHRYTSLRTHSKYGNESRSSRVGSLFGPTTRSISAWAFA